PNGPDGPAPDAPAAPDVPDCAAPDAPDAPPCYGGERCRPRLGPARCDLCRNLGEALTGHIRGHYTATASGVPSGRALGRNPAATRELTAAVTPARSGSPPCARIRTVGQARPDPRAAITVLRTPDRCHRSGGSEASSPRAWGPAAGSPAAGAAEEVDPPVRTAS